MAESYRTVARTPDSVRLQSKLAPLADIIAMLRQTYREDHTRVLEWLRHPQPDFDGCPQRNGDGTPAAMATLSIWPSLDRDSERGPGDAPRRDCTSPTGRT